MNLTKQQIKKLTNPTPGFGGVIWRSNMKQFRIKMKLTKPARSKGGDRYEGEHEDERLTLYFPQKISRATSSGVTPAQELMVEITHG